MPDLYGFNLLGNSVRCIDCEAGGPLWHWPERKRQRHARTHRAAARATRTTELRRRRILLAPPPASNRRGEEGGHHHGQATRHDR